MREQNATTSPASLSPSLISAVAHAPATSAPGQLCAREVGGVTELWWCEEGDCLLVEHDHAVDLSTASPTFGPKQHLQPGAPPARPIHLRIDSYIPSELLLAALTSFGPALESFDWYVEHTLEPDFEARFALALSHAAPTLRRLRLSYNPPLELLPADLPPPTHPSLSPLYQLLPRLERLTHMSTTCARYFAPGAFAFLPASLEHLRIEVFRLCVEMSVPEALLEAFRDGTNDVKGLKTLTVMDDDSDGWEGVEGEVTKAAKGRGVAFERVGESDGEEASEEL